MPIRALNYINLKYNLQLVLFVFFFNYVLKTLLFYQIETMKAQQYNKQYSQWFLQIKITN